MTASIPCQLKLPEARGGTSLDYGLVNVAYQDSSCALSTIYNVPSAASCDAVVGGWYYDNPAAPSSIELCGASCDRVSAPGGRLGVYGRLRNKSVGQVSSARVGPCQKGHDMRHSRHSTLAAIALSLSFVAASACGGVDREARRAPRRALAKPNWPGGATSLTAAACVDAAQCASGLCSNGRCTSGPTGVATSPGPHFVGGGPSSRPLTTGCGPDTAAQCGGSCEMSGGKPATVLAPPATICYSGEGDLTPDDPSSVIEQVIETIDGKTYLHLRVTFDPRFVDNTYGVNASSGWVNKMMAAPKAGMPGGADGRQSPPPKDGMAAKAAHTFDDLVGSDHVELVLVDSKGNTVLDFKVDYISQKADAPCGYGTLGVSGGEGKMITGDASAVVAVATSIDRNLNSCGYCLITDSPATRRQLQRSTPAHRTGTIAWFTKCGSISPPSKARASAAPTFRKCTPRRRWPAPTPSTSSQRPARRIGTRPIARRACSRKVATASTLRPTTAPARKAPCPTSRTKVRAACRRTTSALRRNVRFRRHPP